MNKFRDFKNYLLIFSNFINKNKTGVIYKQPHSYIKMILTEQLKSSPRLRKNLQSKRSWLAEYDEPRIIFFLITHVFIISQEDNQTQIIFKGLNLIIHSIIIYTRHRFQ